MLSQIGNGFDWSMIADKCGIDKPIAPSLVTAMRPVLELLQREVPKLAQKVDEKREPKVGRKRLMDSIGHFSRPELLRLLTINPPTSLAVTAQGLIPGIIVVTCAKRHSYNLISHSSHRGRGHKHSVLSVGISPIDQRLPGGGLGLGALDEVADGVMGHS
jgi:hypothetical protein